jgi:hypothetical protein
MNCDFSSSSIVLQRVANKQTHAKPIKLPYSVGRGFG